jgi:hypothetical protein
MRCTMALLSSRFWSGRSLFWLRSMLRGQRGLTRDEESTIALFVRDERCCLNGATGRHDLKNLRDIGVVVVNT